MPIIIWGLGSVVVGLASIIGVGSILDKAEEVEDKSVNIIALGALGLGAYLTYNAIKKR